MRKFNEYSIRVIYSNGKGEEVCKDINYKEMLKAYKKVKEDFINNKNCVSVELLGIGEDAISIMFSKTFKDDQHKNITEKPLPIKQNNQIELIEDVKILENTKNELKTFNELSEQLKNIANEMDQRKKYIDEKYKEMNKKQQAILHLIEHSISKDNKDKLEIFNKLMNLRRDRRIITIEKLAIDGSGFDRILQDRISKVREKVDFYTKREMEVKEKIDELGLENFEYVKTVKVAHINNLEVMMEHQKKNFPKVIFNEEKMVIECYVKNRFCKYL